MKKIISKNVQRICKEKGWNLQKLIDESGISNKTVRCIYYGERSGYGETLFYIAKALDVSMDELFRLEGLE